MKAPGTRIKKIEPKERTKKDFFALRSIHFLKQYICFEKGDNFNFISGLNVIVGDQGCGKSTLLKCLNNDRNDAWKLDVDHVETRFLDTEKDNPRVIQSLDFAKDVGFTIQSRFMSHGETLLPMVLACKGMQDTVLFIDEPESGLSIRSQHKVAEAILEASQYNQVFVSTHSPIIMRKVELVLDLETRKWVSPEEFIKGQGL